MALSAPSPSRLPAWLIDLGFAWRAIAATPPWSAAIAGILALVVGTTTAFFSLYAGATFRAVDAHDVDRLVTIGTPSPDRDAMNVATGVFYDLRRLCRSFVAVEAAVTDPVASADPQPVQWGAVRLTPGWLDAVRPAFALGGGFFPQDHAQGAAPVALISWRLWQQRFGGARDVVGQVLALQDGRRLTIRGVLGAGFEAPAQAGRPLHLWLPHRLGEIAVQHQRANALVVARLRDGISIEAATAEAAAVLEGLKGRHPEIDRAARAKVLPFSTSNMDAEQGLLEGTFATSLFLLLVGAANIGVSWVGRILRRRREHALRLAIGASRARLVRQTLFEGVLLASMGALLGAGIAQIWIDLVKAGFLSAVAVNPGFRNAGLDALTLAFTALLTIVVAVLISLPAAFIAGRLEIHTSLKESSRTHTPRSVGTVRELLLAVQIALTVVLQVMAVASATALFTTIDELDVGFSNVYVVRLDFPPGEIRNRQTDFSRVALTRLAQLPNVSSVALTSPTPFAARSNDFHDAATVVSPSWVSPRASVPVIRRIVGGDVEATLRLWLDRGRMIGPQDDAESARVVVVDRTFLATFFDGGDPLGRHIRLAGVGQPEDTWEIVGVVDNVAHAPQQERIPTVYLHHRHVASADVDLLVRTKQYVDGEERERLRTSIFQVLHEIDPRQPIAESGSYLGLIWEALLAMMGQFAALFAFSTIAAFLAAAGLYNATASLIVARINELGLRIALGAPPRRVLALVLRLGLRPIAVGTVTGLLLLAGATLPGSPVRAHALAGLGLPLLTITVASVVLFVLAAIFIPAWRASRLAPMAALRYE